MEITLRSPAFRDGDSIPSKYTADGKDISPPLRFRNVPGEARELALICDDPDAPREEPWVHWVIWGISPENRDLSEGIPSVDEPANVAGNVKQGANDFGKVGYGGPAPPEGHGTHHYHFRMFALDTAISLPPGSTKTELLEAMEGHVLAEGELTGTYER